MRFGDQLPFSISSIRKTLVIKFWDSHLTLKDESTVRAMQEDGVPHGKVELSRQGMLGYVFLGDVLESVHGVLYVSLF